MLGLNIKIIKVAKIKIKHKINLLHITFISENYLLDNFMFYSLIHLTCLIEK